MITYLIFMYILIALMCYLGSISRDYDGNLLQKSGLALAGFWCVWRVWLLLNHNDYGHPHEPFIVTFMGVIALGTMQKTLKYCTRRHRAGKAKKLKQEKSKQ